MQVQNQEITGILDQYSLTKTLGSGFSAKVKLATDKDGNEYAIKIFNMENPMNDQRQMELIKQEFEAAKKLDHKYICKYHDFQENKTLQKPNGKTKRVSYLVQEAVLGGELFTYMAETGVFSETMCRHLVKQMLMALHYLHT